MPSVYSNNSNVAEVSNITPGTGDTQSFTLEAKSSGIAVLNGTVPGTSIDCVFPLRVVVGAFQRHPGMDIDLLAEAGLSNDAFKLYCLQRLLHNNDDDTNLFDERSGKMIAKFGQLACGDVSLEAGKALFGRIDFRSSFSSLHIPITNVPANSDISWNDVKYNSATMDAARAAIHAKLQNGIPVRVGCGWKASKSMLRGGALQPNLGGGHFAIIVGCDNAKTRFLFVEVWGGCNLKYGGGISGHTPYPDCNFLGVFELQTLARGPVLRQAASTGQPAGTTRQGSGGFSDPNGTLLEVIAGPTT
jgi:hypothetical protein